MYGVDFRDGTSNSYVCFVAKFGVRVRARPGTIIYRVTAGPTDMTISKRDINDEYQVVKRRANDADLEAILPSADDCGFEWSYNNFIIAMTFWAEGHKLGHSQGRYSAFEEVRNRAASV